MKSLVLLLGALTCAVSFSTGNPFDSFVGTYRVVGTPTVTVDKAKFCNRFGFRNITQFELRPSGGHGYQASHFAFFKNRMGWSTYQISDYTFTDPKYGAGSYAKTSGSEDRAINESGDRGFKENEKLTLTLMRTRSGVILSMREELVGAAGTLAACNYTAHLE